MTKPKNPEALLAVEILEAKPNPLFTEEQRAWVRFLRYNRSVPCAECGKRRKVMWTMLCSFRALTFGSGLIEMAEPEKTHNPLTPVCGDHPLAPAFERKDKTNATHEKNPDSAEA